MSGIPSRSFNRNIKTRFTANQGERLVRLTHVVERTVALLEGDKEAAQKWKNEPSRALYGKTPADLHNISESYLTTTAHHLKR